MIAACQLGSIPKMDTLWRHEYECDDLDTASSRCDQEIDLAHDIADWKKLSENEQHFIKHVLAFFAASDGTWATLWLVNSSQAIVETHVETCRSWSFQSWFDKKCLTGAAIAAKFLLSSFVHIVAICYIHPNCHEMFDLKKYFEHQAWRCWTWIHEATQIWISRTTFTLASSQTACLVTLSSPSSCTTGPISKSNVSSTWHVVDPKFSLLTICWASCLWQILHNHPEESQVLCWKI